MEVGSQKQQRKTEDRSNKGRQKSEARSLPAVNLRISSSLLPVSKPQNAYAIMSPLRGWMLNYILPRERLLLRGCARPGLTFFCYPGLQLGLEGLNV